MGHLDNVVGPQVASAIDRGQLFTVIIKTAYHYYNGKGKPATALILLKAEYLLEKDQPAIEMEVPRSPPEPSYAARSFFTKVAGVTFEGRQRIAARCCEGESLILLRDPNNQFDKGAIKVMRLNGEQLGFIPAYVSRDGDSSGLAFEMDHGSEYQCRIKNITGGGPGQSIGVNIEVTEKEKFDYVLQADGSKASPLAAGTVPTTVQPELLWILALITIIGCILWAALK